MRKQCESDGSLNGSLSFAENVTLKTTNGILCMISKIYAQNRSVYKVTSKFN